MSGISIVSNPKKFSPTKFNRSPDVFWPRLLHLRMKNTSEYQKSLEKKAKNSTRLTLRRPAAAYFITEHSSNFLNRVKTPRLFLYFISRHYEAKYDFLA